MKKYLRKFKKVIFPLKKKKLSEKEERHKLVGPATLWRMKQTFQINFLNEQGLKPEDKLLDVGCGTLRGGIPIIRKLNEGNYWGIDVRHHVIEEAKKELKQEGLEAKKPSLIAFDDFDKLTIENKFDFIFAFSVLIHLEDLIAQKCFHFVSKQLSDSGVFYANVNIEKSPDGSWQGFPVVFRSLDFYRTLAENANLKMREVGRLIDLGHDSKQSLADVQIMLAFSKT